MSCRIRLAAAGLDDRDAELVDVVIPASLESRGWADFLGPPWDPDLSPAGAQ